MRPLNAVLVLVSSALIISSPAFAKDKPATAPSTQAGGTEEPAQSDGLEWPSFEAVSAQFSAQFARECVWALEAGAPREPQVHEITYRNAYDEPDAPDRRMQLYQFFCDSGAYNEQHVFYTVTEYEGARPLVFAEPSFETVYAGGSTIGGEDEKVERLELTGFVARRTLTNAQFDPATGTINSNAAWRGLGDASSHGEYVQEGEFFVLKRFDVDASYDGEMNPENLLDYTATH